MANKDRWCFAWYAQPKGTLGNDRAALKRDCKWYEGSVVSISFLDGDPRVHRRVQDAALQWTKPGRAGLILVFRQDTNDTDIRISFRYSGSWSVIGTSCQHVPANEATMNFGWLHRDSSDEELRRVVLHEFGHALGLGHEHQTPAGGIQWNREQVIADLSGPPNNWDMATIEHNMFEPMAESETNFTALDPQSIMMYPIPATWTTDGFSVGLNSDLSSTDEQFIHTQYP